MILKPQDVYVVLKIVAAGVDRPRYSELAMDLGMSPAETHASVKRAEQVHLLHGEQLKHRPNYSALEEFLLHGLQYVFPAERGGMTRGVATAYAGVPMRRLVAQGDEPAPVWPSATGKQRGIAFAPLHKSAPLAAARDPAFYEYLVLADVLRDGRVREKKIAADELKRRFKVARGQRKP